jgi:hypothetical protein
MFYRLLIVAGLAVLQGSFLFADEFSFEAWEAGIIEDVSTEKSSLEDFSLEDADNDELSKAAIPNALQDVRVSEQRPAYRQRDAEEGISKQAELQNTLLQSDPLEEPEELKLPPPVLFEQPQYSEPTGRTLENNMTTVERP